jgi:hypothetical protein
VRKGLRIKRLVFVCLFLFAASDAALAEQAPTITVKASQSTEQDGTTRYEYRVVNRGPHRITAVNIGYDYAKNIFELQVEPKGWDPQSGIAQGGATSPANWHVNVITEEESPSIEIEWESSSSGTADILPGQTLTGFSIITQEPDDKYLNGHWTAYLSDADPESAALDAVKIPHTFEGD